MGTKTRRTAAVAVLIGVAALAAISFSSSAEDCDGISRRAGGCSSSQPVFESKDCRGVGREIGRQIDERGLAIFEAKPRDESRAVMLFGAQILVVQRANQHLRDHYLVDDCTAVELLAATEETLSAEFKSKVGQHLYDDGQVHSLEEWRSEMATLLKIVDEEEHLQGPDATR